MKVKDLKKAIVEMGDDCDDCEVLLSGSDHSYYSAGCASDSTAGFDGRDYYEWYGMEHASDEERPVRALVVS